LRAILAILIGCGLIAAGIGISPIFGDIPTSVAVVLTILGVLGVLAGIARLKLRLDRRRAYRGGRDRLGTVRLFRPTGEDDVITYLLFSNSHSEWLMSIGTHELRKVRGNLEEGVPARAYLGEDNRIYGLDIGEVKSLPISPGEPYEGKLRDRVDWAERKKAEWSERARKG
jgi:hypothetical protein